MSSAECLREFVNERPTAAAEEIFRVFNKTIVEYEKEIDQQRRLLDIVWKPEIKLYPISKKYLCIILTTQETVVPFRCNSSEVILTFTCTRAFFFFIIIWSKIAVKKTCA